MPLESDVAYLHISNGIRQSETLPHFAVKPAPKKCARGRDRELLMLAFYLNTNDFTEWIDLASKTYFDTPGTVTSATRAAISAVNAKLLDLNRWPPSSGAVTGGMCCAVLRNNDFYIAHVGHGQSLIIRSHTVERVPETAPAPIGAGPHPDIQYFYTTISPADFLILSASIPEGWSSFSHFTSLTLESAIARLTHMAGDEANAMIVRFVDEGAMPIKTRPSITAAPLIPEPKPEPIQVMPPPVREPSPEPASSEPSSLENIIARVRSSPMMGDPDPDAPMLEEESKVEETESASPEEEAVVQIGEHVYEFEEDDDEEQEVEEPSRLQLIVDDLKLKIQDWFAALPLNRGESAIKRRGAFVGSKISSSGASALSRLLPEGVLNPETKIRVPNSTMMAIAILLPLIVGVAVGVVYIQRGRNQQFKEYLDGAKLEAGLARTSADPISAKPHWITAIAYLDQADAVFPSQPDSAQLRAEAQQSVDSVEGTQRLNFEVLVPGGFNSTATITQVVVNGSEVYALDSAHQKVYRAILTKSNKYTMDRTFDCAAGPVGSLVIKRIVDIAWLDVPNIVNQPVLLAVDENGALMYCKPDGTPPQASPLIMPDSGWKKPKAIAIYANRLYVFDPGSNEIWQYDRPSGVFSERPKHYFAGQTPDLNNAISFTISTSGEVYILRGDGRVTHCTRDPATLNTNCTPAMTVADSRTGHSSGDRLDDLRIPGEIYFDPPPEPSLYLLDRGTSAIYQLSLKMVLQRQFKPAATIGEAVTALAVGTNKEVFVAAGANVYWAKKP